jgi:hypothetical protein
MVDTRLKVCPECGAYIGDQLLGCRECLKRVAAAHRTTEASNNAAPEPNKGHQMVTCACGRSYEASLGECPRCGRETTESHPRPESTSATSSTAGEIRGECRRCGATPLQRTLQRTNGLCMTCFQAAGGSPKDLHTQQAQPQAPTSTASTSPKPHGECRRCGSTPLQHTLDRTGGYCMPCSHSLGETRGSAFPPPPPPQTITSPSPPPSTKMKQEKKQSANQTMIDDGWMSTLGGKIGSWSGLLGAGLGLMAGSAGGSGGAITGLVVGWLIGAICGFILPQIITLVLCIGITALIGAAVDLESTETIVIYGFIGFVLACIIIFCSTRERKVWLCTCGSKTSIRHERCWDCNRLRIM